MALVDSKKIGIHKVGISANFIAIALNINYSRGDWYNDNEEIKLYQINGLNDANIKFNNEVYLSDNNVSSYTVIKTGIVIGTECNIAQINIIKQKTNDIIKSFCLVTESSFEEMTK